MSLTAGATSSEHWRRRLLRADDRDAGHAFGVCMTSWPLTVREQVLWTVFGIVLLVCFIALLIEDQVA